MTTQEEWIERLRRASGRITTQSHLVSFLYEIGALKGMNRVHVKEKVGE